MSEKIKITLGKLKIPISYNDKGNAITHDNDMEKLNEDKIIEIDDYQQIPLKAKEVAQQNNKKLTMATRLKKNFYIKTIIKK